MTNYKSNGLTRRGALKFGSSCVGAMGLLQWARTGTNVVSRRPIGSTPSTDLEPSVEKGVAWYDATKWELEGKGWAQTTGPYDRLPSKAKDTVRRAVWDLSRHSAGMVTRFSTNSNLIQVRYRLTSSAIAMSHMPATGVSGVDLYADDSDGIPRWLNVSRPTRQDVSAVLAKGIDSLDGQKSRNFTMYLPLYNGVEKLEIGVVPKSEFAAIPLRKNPLVFYGTSIMHGACASRPGMSISGILGRRLNRSVINLGFSGNGKMELPLAALIGELSASVIAIDCLPNMNGELVRQRTEPFVRKLRGLQPETPILLVEDRSFTNARFFGTRRNHHDSSRRNLKKAFSNLIDDGVKNLFYLEGNDLLGRDGEGATDGSHPNDLGMMRYANAYEQSLKKILRNSSRFRQ